MCKACGVKLIQYAGLCRACGRAAGVYTKTTFKADAERLARQVAAAPAPTAAALFMPSAERSDGDRIYETVWTPHRDAPSLTGDAPGLGTTLAGRSFRIQ